MASRKPEDLRNTDNGMPGMSPQAQQDFSNYNVKYFKASLDDPGDMALLEKLETEAISGKDQIIKLYGDSFSFEGEYFLVVCYLEKKGNSLLRSNVRTEQTTVDPNSETTQNYEV